MPAMTVRHTDHPAAEVLRVLAVSRSSGALEIRGTPSGTIFLHEGEVTYAEAPGIPVIRESSLAGLSDLRLQSTIHSSIVEAGLTLLTGPRMDGERPLFRSGRRHWTGLICRLEVDRLLAEIEEHLSSFAGSGVGVDDEVQLCRLPRGTTAVLSRQQWALAAEMSGRQTTRSLAWRSGRTLTATIDTVASLVIAGVARLDQSGFAADDTVPIATVPVSSVPVSSVPVSSVPASSVPASSEPGSRSAARAGRPRREPVLRRVEPVGLTSRPEARLPHRVRGATALPSVSGSTRTEAAAGSGSGPEVEADGRRALAARLLEGLRRL